MKMNYNDIALSGKGFRVINQEWNHENIKLMGENCDFHELVEAEGSARLGWIVLDKVEIIADFTTHTERGMEGKSVHDTIEYPMILDANDFLGDFVPENIEDVNTEISSKILEKMKISDVDSHISLDQDNDKFIALLSTKTEYFLLQSDKNSIRIFGRFNFSFRHRFLFSNS